MITGSVLFVHLIAAFFGARPLWKQNRKKEAGLLIAVVSISAYAAIARRASLPLLTITDAINFVFGPLETWLETVMGGPF